MITAITNYLLILIKDIDTFSEIQFGTSSLKQTNLSFTKIDLKELTSFIYMIAKYLIHKNHFDNKISFQIISKNLPQFITTDEIKLKQILRLFSLILIQHGMEVRNSNDYKRRSTAFQQLL